MIYIVISSKIKGVDNEVVNRGLAYNRWGPFHQILNGLFITMERVTVEVGGRVITGNSTMEIGKEAGISEQLLSDLGPGLS